MPDGFGLWKHPVCIGELSNDDFIHNYLKMTSLIGRTSQSCSSCSPSVQTILTDAFPLKTWRGENVALRLLWGASLTSLGLGLWFEQSKYIILLCFMVVAFVTFLNVPALLHVSHHKTTTYWEDIEHCSLSR